MDVPKYSSETAMGSKNLFDSGSKISSASSKVSPINKKNSEFFDEAMVCEDDWLDYDDDDEDKDEGNQSDNAESPPLVVTEEIPPKDDRPSSGVTFTSPKRKRTKFPNFDELLQNLNFDALNLNLTKLLLFLESANKERAFLFTLNEYEEFFKMVLEDINILKSKSLDACYRDICDKILKAASCYTLTYVYEYKMELQKIVMVIKKAPIKMMDQSEEDTSTFSRSKESTKPAKVSNAKVLPRPMTPTISIGFKIHCLRTLLAFVKYDETKTKEFPELSPDQVVYMEFLLESNGTGNDFEKNWEVKQLYRALWEAMKIYSLKYEFKIECEDSWCGKKNLTFKKIPKQKSGSGVDLNQTVNLKPETENLETPAQDEAACFEKPEIPNLPAVQQNATRLTKKMLQNQIKLENEVLFIKRLPVEFVSDTLNTILEFLMDDERNKLVFLPKNQPELCFYRKVFDWCRTWYCVSKFGEEFERLHHKISSLLPRFEIQSTKRKGNKINDVTGVREVVYIKHWHKSKSGSQDSVQSAPKKKKKKVNLQNALELAGTEQIKLASVVDLNQSLRNKKKNKKKKKAKLRAAAVASNEASSKRSNKSKTWSDDSSSECSSRSTSRDRAKLASIAQSTSKKAVNENQIARRHEANTRRNEEMNRKEQLKEALSVPVQSDKAVRMMRGMGWSGGALGARGIGITEPLMPKLDITRGAGLGHIRGSQPETSARKSKETKSTTSFVSESQTVTEITENDIVVKKTKELLRENTTFDSVLKIVELPKQECNVELSKPNVALTKRDVEPIYSQHFSRQEFLKTILELLNAGTTHKTLKYYNKIPTKGLKFVKNCVSIINRRKVNYSIFQSAEFSIYTQIQFEFKKIPRAFLEAKFSCDVKTLVMRKNMPAEQTPTKQMETELKSPAELMPTEQTPTKQMETELKSPAELMPTELDENPTQHNLLLPSTNINSEIITEEHVKSFISSTMSLCTTPKANAILKFKVLFLFNILNFVKSLNEESEVTFNKILTLKEKTYIQNIVDEVNMRIKCGSTPAETQLCQEIRKYIADAFLGAMFNHQYTVVTLNKYYRFKRLNRPDNAVKRKCQTNINLDIYKSETVSHKLTDKENDNNVAENKIKVDEDCSKVAENFSVIVDNCSKVAEYNRNVAESCSKVSENCSEIAKSCSIVDENYSNVAENSNKVFENDNYDEDILLASSDDDITNPYDSDESSVDEYDINNATATVPRLLPGEEGVNVSNFLYLYDKKKTNTSDINDTSNINNASASKMTENINNKNNIGNGNVVIDNNDNQIIDMKRDSITNTNIKMTEKETDAIDSEINRPDIVTEKHEEIDAVIANTKDRIDKKDMLAASWEDILKNDVFIFTGNTSNSNDADVIMKDDVIEMMEVISITDNKEVKKEENSKKGTEIKERNCNITSEAQKVIQESNNLDSKTDCDILKKGTIVISKNNCDTQSEAVKFDTEKDVPNIFNDTGTEIKTNNSDTQSLTAKNNTDKVVPNIFNDTDTEIKTYNSDTQSLTAKNNTDKVVPNIFNDTDTEIKTYNSDTQSEAAKNGTDKVVPNIFNDTDSEIKTYNADTQSEAAKNGTDKVVPNIFNDTDTEMNTNNFDTQSVAPKNGTEKVVPNIFNNTDTEMNTNNCDTQSLTAKNDTEKAVPNIFKDTDTGIKTVRIVHFKHPIIKLNNEKITEIQRHISNSIILSIQLPFLKCHGVQNGALIYSCHNEETYDWLRNTIGIASLIKVLDTEEVTKMTLRMCCFYDCNYLYVCKMIELYNKGLSTKEWVVEKTERDGDHIVFIIKMDKLSIKFIQESNFALFAGIDKVQFSPIWE